MRHINVLTFCRGIMRKHCHRSSSMQRSLTQTTFKRGLLWISTWVGSEQCAILLENACLRTSLQSGLSRDGTMCPFFSWANASTRHRKSKRRQERRKILPDKKDVVNETGAKRTSTSTTVSTTNQEADMSTVLYPPLQQTAVVASSLGPASCPTEQSQYCRVCLEKSQHQAQSQLFPYEPRYRFIAQHKETLRTLPWR